MNQKEQGKQASSPALSLSHLVMLVSESIEQLRAFK